MPENQRVGDANDAGGRITSGVETVRVNNLPISVDGSPVSSHGKNVHAGPTTAGGVASVRARNIAVNVTGNKDTCGHTRVGGSPNVRTGG